MIELVEIGAGGGSRRTVANVAAAWVLHQLGPDGGWVIIGVRDDSHLIEHKALRDLVLDAEDAAKINELRRIEGYLAHLQPGARIHEIRNQPHLVEARKRLQHWSE